MLFTIQQNLFCQIMPKNMLLNSPTTKILYSGGWENKLILELPENIPTYQFYRIELKHASMCKKTTEGEQTFSVFYDNNYSGIDTLLIYDETCNLVNQYVYHVKSHILRNIRISNTEKLDTIHLRELNNNSKVEPFVNDSLLNCNCNIISIEIALRDGQDNDIKVFDRINGSKIPISVIRSLNKQNTIKKMEITAKIKDGYRDHIIGIKKQFTINR